MGNRRLLFSLLLPNHEGEVLFIPSHLPHKAVALEDTLDVDVCPVGRTEMVWIGDRCVRVALAGGCCT